MTISKRKDQHIKIAKNKNSQYNSTTGFEEIEFIHCALPELDLEKIELQTNFLGKKISMPMMIGSMTGGTALAKKINQALAKAAEEELVPLALGSYRPLLENENAASSFMVRKLCPSVPLIANIGAVQLKEYNIEKIEQAIKKTEADALAIHLNPLQESIQPEGQTNFEGVYQKIAELADALDVPVIVKETGAGINSEVAKKLANTAIKYVDVSGKGGTSWSKVEYKRGGKITGFEEWGYSTALAIVECSKFIKTIASGGIRNGIDAAKAIALGADMASASWPFLEKPAQKLKFFKEQLKRVMFLVGAKNIDQLKQAPLLIYGKLAHAMRLKNIALAYYAPRTIK
ncbi:MAG: type 2 isopentenyl-diphosphate Delta-isomerase [Candidatus Micrarchaeota archaeon]|nr:type 2 isopentenyl-diphosphate Delta-isomerase [Candidatus Micrarchaeota archaeon]